MRNRQGVWVIVFRNPVTGDAQRTPYNYKTENGVRRALLFLQDNGGHDYESKFISAASDNYDFLEALYAPESLTVNLNQKEDQPCRP